MARLAEQKNKLDLAGIAHLAGAFYLAGRTDRAMELQPTDVPQSTIATSTSGRLTTQIRQEAVLLSVLLDINPESPLGLCRSQHGWRRLASTANGEALSPTPQHLRRWPDTRYSSSRKNPTSPAQSHSFLPPALSSPDARSSSSKRTMVHVEDWHKFRPPRDAWAVGHNGRYAIGVWVGRFRGTGEVAFVGARASEPLLARLFDLPILRANADPAPPQPIPVRHPLPPPPELADAVWIVSPGNGEKFIALDGKTAVLPRAKGQGKLAWFLDGLLLAPSQTARLILPPGRYKLRCVDMAGRSSAVTFLVL